AALQLAKVRLLELLRSPVRNELDEDDEQRDDTDRGAAELPSQPPAHLPPPRRDAAEQRAVVRPRAGALDVDAPHGGDGEDDQAGEGDEAQHRAAEGRG